MKIPAKDVAVKNLKPQDKRFIAWFDKFSGFGVRVSAYGKKTFIYRYKFEGKARMLTIGKYPEAFKLKEAIAEYRKQVAAVARGGDPSRAKQKIKEVNTSTPTVAEFVEKDYLERYAKVKKRTWKEDQRYLNNDVIPFIGDIKITKVTKKDIIRIIDRVTDRGAGIAANRLLACVRKVFNYAVERAELDFSPVTGIKAPEVERVRDRILSPEEIKNFWRALDSNKYAGVISDALKMLILTVKRKGELIQARWEHVDFDKRLLYIPAENSKNKVAHSIPLNEMALDILINRKANAEGSEYVFTPVRKKEVMRLGITTLDHFMRKNLCDLGLKSRVTPHDLRRTALTILAERRVRPDIRQKILNHVDSSTMGQHYDKYDYLPEMRAAMDKLNAHVLALVSGGVVEKKKVVSIVR